MYCRNAILSIIEKKLIGKGGRGRRWQRDEERGTGRGEIRSVRELSPEVGREGNVWGEEMAPPLQSCARCAYSKAEGFVILFFTPVWVSVYVGCVLYMYIVDCYHYVYMYSLCKHIRVVW